MHLPNGNIYVTISYEYSGRRIHSPGWHQPLQDVKWFSGIGEYVIDWGPGYRIYLAKDGNALIVLFGGGTKRRQQADIDRAVVLHMEYKSRKAPKAAANKAEKRKR